MNSFADGRLRELRFEHGLEPANVPGPVLCYDAGRHSCGPKNGCTPTFCKMAHRYGPIIHLPYAWQQGGECTYKFQPNKGHDQFPGRSESTSDWCSTSDWSSSDW